MPLVPRIWDATGGALLWRAGRAGQLTTIGRSSGQPRTVRCGFLERPDGSILIGSVEGRQWPANLAAAGWCEFEWRGRAPRRFLAEELHGEAKAGAVEELRAGLGERAARMFSERLFLLREDTGVAGGASDGWSDRVEPSEPLRAG